MPIDGSGIRDKKVGSLILTGCALCHDLTYHETMACANLIDRALMSYAEANGMSIERCLRQYHRIYQKPFRSEDRYVACGFIPPGRGNTIYFTKGDPYVVLKMCRRYMDITGERKPLDLSFLSAFHARMSAISKDGGIVIAIAYNDTANAVPSANYTFLGLIQLQNPIRTETRKVLHRLSMNGIKSVILTGDRRGTAMKVALEAGFGNAAKYYLTGRNMERMPLSEVMRQSEYVSLFTELLPSQKAVIIRLLQQRGHRIAMIGDGTNDAMALRAADVGISFNEQRSPLARKSAKVLVNDLSDILTVTETSYRIRRQTEWMIIGITLVFLVILWGT